MRWLRCARHEPGRRNSPSRFEAANNSAILARTQYRAGLTDFQILLDAERSLVNARDGMARGARRRSARSGSALSRAWWRLGPVEPANRWNPLMNDTIRTVTNAPAARADGAPDRETARSLPRRARRATLVSQRRPGSPARSGWCWSCCSCRAASPARAWAAMRRRRCGAATSPSRSPPPAISSRPTRSRSAPSNPAW